MNYHTLTLTEYTGVCRMHISACLYTTSRLIFSILHFYIIRQLNRSWTLNTSRHQRWQTVHLSIFSIGIYTWWIVISMSSFVFVHQLGCAIFKFRVFFPNFCKIINWKINWLCTIELQKESIFICYWRILVLNGV